MRKNIVLIILLALMICGTALVIPHESAYAQYNDADLKVACRFLNWLRSLDFGPIKKSTIEGISFLIPDSSFNLVGWRGFLDNAALGGFTDNQVTRSLHVLDQEGMVNIDKESGLIQISDNPDFCKPTGKPAGEPAVAPAPETENNEKQAASELQLAPASELVTQLGLEGKKNSVNQETTWTSFPLWLIPAVVIALLVIIFFKRGDQQLAA
jgi:hypothetical protein